MGRLDPHERAIPCRRTRRRVQNREEQRVFQVLPPLQPSAEFGFVRVGTIEQIAPQFRISRPRVQGLRMLRRMQGDDLHVPSFEHYSLGPRHCLPRVRTDENLDARVISSRTVPMVTVKPPGRIEDIVP